MPLQGTIKDEKGFDLSRPSGVALERKRAYTRSRTASGHTGRKHSSAPSLKGKLTGETWSHHQMSLSQEKHAEECLCLWYPTWQGSHTHLDSNGGTYASDLHPLLRD